MPDREERRSVWRDQPPLTVSVAEGEEAFGLRPCHGRGIDSVACLKSELLFDIGACKPLIFLGRDLALLPRPALGVLWQRDLTG
jgi:hypothetical protein